jgi:tripartite-type tricarboxylate transporter receptor subunit TctC
VSDFITWAKAHGMVDWASPVPGSAPHFMGTQLAAAAGLSMNHVPYRGSAPAVQDLLAGTIKAVILPIGDVSTFHRSGDARVLAVTSAQRLPRLPDIQTFAEAGLGTLTGSEWYGALLPAGASAATVAQLHGALAAAAATPEIRDGLTRVEMSPAVQSPEEFKARVARETEHWRGIVAASGFRIEE